MQFNTSRVTVSTLLVPYDELLNAIRVMDEVLSKTFGPRFKESPLSIAIFDMDRIHFPDLA